MNINHLRNQLIYALLRVSEVDRKAPMMTVNWHGKNVSIPKDGNVELTDLILDRGKYQKDLSNKELKKQIELLCGETIGSKKLRSIRKIKDILLKVGEEIKSDSKIIRRTADNSCKNRYDYLVSACPKTLKS